MFQPGDVVVCVDDRVRDDGPFKHLYSRALKRLRNGSVYRVTRAEKCPHYGDSVVALEGVRNADICPDWNDGWQADRFRKIDDDVTEEFREVLRKLPVSTIRSPARHMEDAR